MKDIARLISQTLITMAAIAGIVYLERMAIVAGIDGAFFFLSLAAMAGLGGYEIKNIGLLINKLKEKKHSGDG